MKHPDYSTTTTTGSRAACRTALLLSLLLPLIAGACQPLGTPTIVLGRPCTLSPGQTIPLAVTGVQGSGIIYEWNPSAGTVTPPTGEAVQFTAPSVAGQVIIKVTAKKDNNTSDGTIICNVEATPTPPPTVTNTPRPTDTLAPTYTPRPTDTPAPTEVPTPPPVPPPGWIPRWPPG